MKDQTLYRIPLKRGEEVHIRRREYKDKQYIDLRLFFTPKDSDQLVPTKKGLTLDLGLIEELRRGITTSEKRLRMLDSENEETSET